MVEPAPLTDTGDGKSMGAGDQTPVTGVTPATPAPPPADKTGSIFFQFVVFPLAIVTVAIAITGLFTWLAQDRRSYDDYLHEIANGWAAKRGQAAYELSFRIADQHPTEKLRQQADVAKTLAVFDKAKKEQDPQVRRYLAVVLGHLGKSEALPALIEALDDPDVETRLNATWALGRIHDTTAVPILTKKLEDEFEGQRKLAAFALGELGDKQAADALLKATGDAVVDVRWNATLALARLKDKRAVPMLLLMLDRRGIDEVQATPGKTPGERLPMNDQQREAVIVNAIRGVLALEAQDALPALDKLAGEDRSYTVRRAAMEARDKLRGTANPPK
jgi:HEAT repeat protein